MPYGIERVLDRAPNRKHRHLEDWRLTLLVSRKSCFSLFFPDEDNAATVLPAGWTTTAGSLSKRVDRKSCHGKVKT